MSTLKILVEYEDMDDWVALHIKEASDEAVYCKADECINLEVWTAVDLVGGKAELELEPGKYYYRYEAANTAGNKVNLEFFQEDELILKPVITIGSGNNTVGCNIFRIWS